MSTNHNRIRVADLETNQQNKILTTNSAGELEFTDINTIQVDNYNALDYNSEGKALDARQGKVLKDLTDNKVDKVNGKSLLSDAEITRLGTLSNYNHPTNHAPSIITQDTNNRFVTDAEKATWNSKQSSLPFVPENATNKNIAGGYAGLGSDGKLISSQLPAITINDTFVIASQAAMLAQTAQTGDLAVRTDLNKSFILKGTNPAVLADWQELLSPTSAVTTVFGRNGTITSQTGDYTADKISETASRKFQSANQQAFNDATSSIQTQLNAKQSSLTFVPENVTNKNVAGGYAGLGSDGKLISSQLPAITINDTFVIASQAAMLAQTAQTGDLAVRTDLNKSFILKGTNPAVLADWQELLSPTSAVTTVFGRNGAITSQTGDYTADQISETASRKFQSANQQAFNDATSSIQTQLNTKQSSLTFVPENVTNKNIAGGYAGLGSDGKLISSQLPAITINDTFVIASQAAMLAQTAQTGDLAVRTDLNKSFILKGTNPAVLADWQELLSPTSAVTTVFGRNGTITSQTGDYTADKISETASRKFQSANQQAFNDATSSIQTQLNTKASTTGSGASGTWGINITGNANTATNSSQIGGISSNRLLMKRRAKIASAESTSLNSSITQPEMGFTYGGSGEPRGPYIAFGGLNGDIDYSCQLAGAYIEGNEFKIRTKNDDAAIWNPWRTLITDGNYATYSTFSGVVSSGNGFQTASIPGNGYGFWGGHPNTYGILMADAGNSSYGGRIPGETTSDYNMYFSMAQGVNRGFVFRNAVNTPLLAIHNNGIRASNDVIAFSSSDERLKDNITKIQDPIEKLNKINGYMFDWNTNQNTHTGHDIGVIAQEIELIIPEIVTTRKNGYKAVKYDKLIPLLIEVAKTQQTQIEKQQQIIEEQNDKIKFILKHLNLQL
ncbi:tail fiber domain-containing protein [Flavobacterium sp. LS1R47]|uniref:Tail fiber domain-containing protein n=1 Tax=Flavobacterium frigoritolerans TaxID=2987686 RepID=A0A9X3C7M1_9FLAO|nr:tail fiber domain-containing protein [Flavobacterium frigoritolerans]MCV9931752.1 tail fiber domain-containing protein [Flavobacterium frigoritolerans]